MALAAYSTKLRLPSYELESIWAAIGIDDKLNAGELTLEYARTTSFGGTIDRVINAAACQVATVHRLFDEGGALQKVYPESVVIGDVLFWRLGHQKP
jgi:hypothetical protein